MAFRPLLLYAQCNLGYRYDDKRVIKWMLKQAGGAFQGVSGSFDD